MSAFDPLRTLAENGTTSVVRPDIKSFCKAVGAGTIAGGGPYLFLTVPLAVGDLFSPIDGTPNVFRDLYLAGLPVLVALALVLSGSIVIGIPTAMILRKGPDQLGRYVLIGITTGLLIPLLGSRVAGAEWGPAVGMGIFGAVSGGVTALTWSKATQKQKA
jgi:hypothetical protein